jgi:hypothetical protein
MTDDFEHKTDTDPVAVLSQDLLNAGVDLSTWGQPGRKSVADLLDEINAGESELTRDTSGQLWRITNGLGLDVFATIDGKRYYLVEDHQEFTDGSLLRRGISTSLGEKIKRGESIEEVAVRALREELGLGLTSSMVIVLGDETASERPSNSYPGLRTIVRIHRAAVEILPEQFHPQGYVEYQEKKSTHFLWQRIGDDTSN